MPRVRFVRKFAAAFVVTVIGCAVMWQLVSRRGPVPVAVQPNASPMPPRSASMEKSAATAVGLANPNKPAASGAGESPIDLAEAATVKTPASEFSDWLSKYRAALTEGDKEALVAEGATLAAQRRDYLFDLIKNDPEAAIAAAVPMCWRNDLPLPIQAQLEERVSGRGFYGVLIATDFERGQSEVRREVRLGQVRYDAYVYGSWVARVTQGDVALQGIALRSPSGESRLAVDKNPVRLIEQCENVPPATGAELCPVSSRPSASKGAETLAEVAGQVERFCGPAHVELLNQRLAADSGGLGGSELPPTAKDNWTQGPKTCLFMRVAFPDDPTEPITEDGAYAMMDGVNQWYIENSYDTTSIIPTVTPLLMLPQPKSWYSQQGTGTLLSDAREAARQAGFDTDTYSWDIVRHSSVPGFNYGGLGYVRGKGTWLQSSSVGVACHELGHNYGIWHANSWTAAGDSVIGPGSHVEYGNSFDTMGAASAGNNQFNAAFKSQLDWLADSYVHAVTASGTYRIYTYDIPNLIAGQKYALKVKKDYDRNYWAEFRQKFVSNRWFNNGIILNWDPWNNGVVDSAGGTHLLDTTPGTPSGSSSKEDCAVIIGRTFSDPAAGVHFTPVAKGGVFPQGWIDVVVKLGEFPGNTAPVASVLVDRTSAPINSPVNFSASAADADGDVMAYWWDFGDETFGPNSPNATKSWATAGEYTVRCTVSDMKGGIYNQKVVITVGAPATFRVNGRVTTASGVPVEGVRIYNGASGTSYRGTYTDSDGYYTLANVGAGQVNVLAVKYGYALSPVGWNSPVTLGPSANGLNWTATPGTTVSIAASDAAASEAGSNPGQFRLSRVGDTNVALAVKLNRTGTAAFNSDYTLSPAPAGTPLQFTIPAGQAFLNINVTPMSDAVSEGPEAVTLTLIEDPTYVLGGLAEATVIIADDDPAAKPTVDVSASSPSALADNVATEGGEDTGVFTFTRSGGGTANELVVYYTVTGSATPGADYTALAGVVTIPAGEAVTAVPFKAIDDLLVETNETVIVTILANAAYNGAGDQTSIAIIDNDPTTVTITATDDVGREAGASPGAFTVTREGNLSANLVVTYAMSGSAANTADYATLSGTVTIPAGRATATVTVTPVNDAFLEGDETVVATLLASPVYNVGNPGSATVTIVDDELPSVTLAASDASASEASGNTGTYTFTRTGSTAASMLVRFAVKGTAVNGLDYVTIGNTIQIPAGSATATLTITPIDDSFLESSERVALVLLPDAAYSVGTTTPQTVTIADNDSGLPAVGFSFLTSSGPESDTSVQLSVGLSTSSASDVTVNYAVTGGTASGSGVDYTLAAGRLTFAAGILNQSVNISLNNDTTAESDETIVVTLSGPSGAVLDAIPTHTFTIIDDDTSGAITVTALDATAAEAGSDTGTFRISRSGSTANAQTVFYQVVGSASAPSDYVGLGGSAVIPAGASFVDLLVTPVNDTTDETNETVVLNLIKAPGGRIASPDVAAVTIVDDDTSVLAVVTVEATDPIGSEPGVDTGTFTFRRTGDLGGDLLVTFSVGGTATSGSDYTALGTSVTIPAGAEETAILLTARDDAGFESNETVTVTLTLSGSYLVGASASAEAVIVDNEIGVSITSVGSSVEDGSSLGQFVVSRTGSTVADLTVNVLVGGTASSGDYSPLGTVVVIPGGQSEVSVPVVPVNDLSAEGNETVIMTLAAGAGYTVTTPNSATLVLLDDEPGVSVTATDGTAYEGGSDGGRFAITRTGSTNAPLTVRFDIAGTASNGVDYAALSGTAIIPTGQRVIEVVVAPIDDPTVEGNETVQLSLHADPSYALLAPTSALVALVDDEVNLIPAVAIMSPPNELVYMVNNGSALVLEAIAVDDGRPNPPGTLLTTWTKVSGPGTVTFGNSNALNTTARFGANGTYVLRLSADDSQLSSADEVTVIVNPDSGLTTGLQAYWRFDETNGAVAADSSGNGRNAALANGATFAPGQIRNGLELDGVDDLASFNAMALSQLTVTAWIRADSQGDSTTPRVLAMPGYNIRIRRDTASTTNCVAIESQRSTTSGEWRSPGDVVSDGAWYHIAVSYDSASTDNDPLFYVNGVLQQTLERSAPVGTQTSNAGTGYIGNTSALNRSWDGRIDEMRIYNRILSAAEVQRIFAGPPANVGPFVDAGPAQTIPLAGTATLNGLSLDDGLPTVPGAVTLHWSQVSGPGSVAFADDTLTDTTATFSESGVYVLRLQADDGEVKTADDVTVTVLGPTTVSIQASDNLAAEIDFTSAGNPGVFTLSRVGDITSALSVSLSIGGTAASVADYQALPAVVVMPANVPLVEINVWAIKDGIPEGDETVEMTILPDPAYLVGAVSSATVKVQDAPWDEWRLGHFTAAELGNPAISGALANPDGDAFQNVLEYAFNLNPKATDTGPDLAGAIEQVGTLGNGQASYVVRFHRRIAAVDLSYELEVSTDLNAWQSGPNYSRFLLPPTNDGNGVTETVRAQVFGPLTLPSQRFVRLKVTLQ